MKYSVLLIVCISIVCFPARSFAAVRFSEIAWMGIEGKNGQYGEWIELYNEGESSVSLKDWTITKGGSTQKNIVTLPEYTLAPHEYVVIERSTASVPDPLPSIQHITLPFGASGMSNAGEHLLLSTKEKNTEDALLFQNGWPAGDVETKQTMQYHEGVWNTAPGTPGLAMTMQGGISSDTNSKEQSKQLLVNSESLVQKEASSTFKHIPAGIQFSLPDTVYTGVVYPFAPIVNYDDMRVFDGYFVINFGDGISIRSTTMQSFPHRYSAEGKYVLSFAYYNSEKDTTPLLKAHTIITVQAPRISLRLQQKTKTLYIANTASTTIDISGWSVSNGYELVTLPDMTLLAPKSSIGIVLPDIGITTTYPLTMVQPLGRSVAQSVFIP